MGTFYLFDPSHIAHDGNILGVHIYLNFIVLSLPPGMHPKLDVAVVDVEVPRELCP